MNLLTYNTYLPDTLEYQKRIPLFILHGLLGSKENWRNIAKHFSQYRPVYALDLRNHGDSPHMKGMSYREMYQDVIKVAKHENRQSFYLLGHSMGGKVAMQLALSEPSYVKKLIVVDIAPRPYPLWHQKTLAGLLSVPFDKLETRKEIDRYLEPWIADKVERVFILKNLKRNKKGQSNVFSWRCNLQEISRSYLKIANFTVVNQTFKGDTLFIRGEHSHYIQDSDIPLVKLLFPKSSIISINSASHLPHIQNTEAFILSVTNFLSGD